MTDGDRLSNIERRLDEHGKTCPQTGILSKIRQQQASCPRAQIKFLWWFVAGVGAAIAGLAASVFKLVAYP
ncbi:MAG: hypothetical protein HY788_06800 [Deltaproteobacteria bacterium]|nr:hypothetical protein [Deltaproteobacteria bacterium]